MAERSVPLDRAPAADRDPELVRPSLATHERWLRQALLDDIAPARLPLLDTLVGLCELRVVPDIGGSVRADAWRTVLTMLLDLGAHSPYVGGFKVRLDAIVEAGAPLTGTDRGVLARLLLERTAAMATHLREYRSGVLVARQVDPSVLAPTAVIDAVLRPCVRRSSPGGVVATALTITCDALARGGGACVTDRDVWALRAALDAITEHDREKLHPYIERMTGADRALLDRIITREAPPRRWSLGRAFANR